MELFPMMKSMNLRLASLQLEEEQAQYYVERAMAVYDLNVVGPQEYTGQYARYDELLTDKAEREADSFLLEKRTIDEMKAVRQNALMLRSYTYTVWPIVQFKTFS